MYIIDIGHTNIKILNNQKIITISLDDLKKFKKFLLKQKKQIFFIGSVNLGLNKFLFSFLDQHKFKYRFLSNSDFESEVKIDKTINFNEIGLDILSSVYYLNDKNYLLVNNGTAMVIIKYSNKLDSVIIGPNISFGFEQLKNKTSLVNKYSYYPYLGNDTNKSLNGFISLFLVNPIIEILKDHKINKLYLNQLDKGYFKTFKKLKVIEKDNLTILGYMKLIQKKNLVI